MYLHTGICIGSIVARNLLLLGGNGFIGKALAQKYARLGDEVHIISRQKPMFPLSGIQFHQASLDNVELLQKLIPQCSLVIHAASTCTPASSATQPSKEGEENLLPLLRLLEMLSDYPPRQFIFMSSGGTVYGNPSALPVTEDAPLLPISYHGAAKSAAEHFLHAFAHSSFPVTILRPSNIYGPGQEGPSGFGIIKTILQHLKSDTPMEIWGDGKTLRDYLYIDDLVEGVTQVQQQNCTGAFNIGSGIGRSVDELIDLAQLVTGRNLSIVRKPAKVSDVKGIVLDYGRLAKTTGWAPRMSLEAGIGRTWEWLLQQP